MGLLGNINDYFSVVQPSNDSSIVSAKDNNAVTYVVVLRLPPKVRETNFPYLSFGKAVDWLNLYRWHILHIFGEELGNIGCSFGIDPIKMPSCLDIV